MKMLVTLKVEEMMTVTSCEDEVVIQLTPLGAFQ